MHWHSKSPHASLGPSTRNRQAHELKTAFSSGVLPHQCRIDLVCPGRDTFTPPLVCCMQMHDWCEANPERPMLTEVVQLLPGAIKGPTVVTLCILVTLR